MKLVIIADIHGNLDALAALPEDYDELWVLGDQVNYGPQPAEVVEFVRARAALAVQGNHDHAAAHDDDSRWSNRFRALAEATRRHSSAALTEDQKAYLRALPAQAQAERGGCRFHLVHATPDDPFYGRRTADDPAWAADLAALDCDVLLTGHSHKPFLRRIGGKTVLNPGSLGQPRNGQIQACYAVWQDGDAQLKSFAYPVESTIAKLKALAFAPAVEAHLITILTTGAV